MNLENKENLSNYQLLKGKPSVCSTSLHFSKLITVIQFLSPLTPVMQWFKLNFGAGNFRGRRPGTSALRMLLRLTAVKARVAASFTGHGHVYGKVELFRQFILHLFVCFFVYLFIICFYYLSNFLVCFALRESHNRLEYKQTAKLAKRKQENEKILTSTTLQFMGFLRPPHTSRFFVGRQKICTCRLVCGEFRQVSDKIGACRARSDSARSQNVLSGLGSASVR